MSKPITLPKPAACAVSTAPTTPPAGPDRIASLPRNRLAEVSPPEDCINKSRGVPAWEPDPPLPCGERGIRLPSWNPATLIYAVLRWANLGQSVPGQGRDPVRPRGRRGRRGGDGARGRLRQGDRLRHGRHLHRCLPL